MRANQQLPFKQALPWVGLVTVLFCFVYSSRAILAPLLVSIEIDLNIGHAQATTLLLTQSLGFSIALLISGFTLSYIKPAHVVTFSVIGSGMCFLCAPTAVNLETTRWLFLMFGLCAGLYLPAALTTLSSITLSRDWGKTVSIHELAPPLSFIVVPFGAQAALNHTNWQGTLQIVGACMCACGLLFAAIGRGGQSTVPPISLNGCTKLLTYKPAVALGILMSFAMVGEFSIFSVLQIYLVDAQGVNPATANHILSLTRLVSPFAVLFGGIVADRWNIFSIIRWCMVLHAITLTLMALDSYPLALTGATLQGAVVGVLFPSVFKTLIICFSHAEQPILLSLSMPIGGLLSVGVVPLFLGYCGQYLTFGVGFIGLAVISILCLLTVAPLEKIRQDM